MASHGFEPHSSVIGHRGRSDQDGTTFGRMFGYLESLRAEREALIELGAAAGPMNAGAHPAENPDIPLGFVFLGQFIDHDITLDTTSSLDARSRPREVVNIRTPALDLDCVYGRGPEAAPYLYLNNGDFKGIKLLTGCEGKDLPRNREEVDGKERPQRALIGDPRNDENRVVSQLQLLFLKFHNAVVNHLAREENLAGKPLFEEAQRLVRWHYQWMVVHEFLPKIAGRRRTKRAQRWRRFYRPRKRVYMPVEFSVAAYRYGHSQVPSSLKLQPQAQAHGLFSRELGLGFQPIKGDHEVVDWAAFFKTGAGTPQLSHKIDAKLDAALLELPEQIVGPDADPSMKSLASRNLLRHATFGLPSGEHVAAAMNVSPLASGQLWSGVRPSLAAKFADGAPLWYYILKESEIRHDGRRLGPVGGHIVAEVLVGLMQLDRTSYLCADPGWKPTLPRADGSHAKDEAGDRDRFRMADIVALAAQA